MDQEYFKKHIIPLQPAMQLLAERMLGDPDDAEDLVQDVFLHLWQNRDKLANVDNLQGYAISIVRTRSIDLLRLRKRHSEHTPTIELISDTTITQEVEETKHESDLLHELLDQLPEKQQQLLKMRYLQQLDIPAIENSTGLTSANIYTTISRALGTLRDKLKKMQQ